MQLIKKNYIITLIWCIVEQFYHCREIIRPKNIEMDQVWVANQSNSARFQKLNFAQFLAFSNFIYQKNANHDKIIPLPSTFGQLLPIHQICVAKMSTLLRKVVFLYSARINFFSTLRIIVKRLLLYSFYLYSGYDFFTRLNEKSSVFHE